ncbi:MAG: homoserine dehydrogenase [Lactobacillaceae bacterium]|nr:homoserine dehydrogenase [Lactobacillaceae bacterium]
MAIEVGLLGLGTVGEGVVELLAQRNELPIEITKVAVRTITPARATKYANLHLTTDPWEVVNAPSLAIVIEVMGGIELPYALIKQALQNGKSVVTANKDLLATHGVELSALAQAQGVWLRYEASVAGGIPILNALATSFPYDKIQRVAGIVNGTSNFILSKMANERCSYELALKIAQNKGFAESDPTNDVSGLDAAYKLAILSKFAFGATPAVADIKLQGIERIAEKDIAAVHSLGFAIKPLAVAELNNDKLALHVSPYLIDNANPLVKVNDEYNGIFVSSQNMPQQLFYGAGAGMLPTANAVTADVCNIAQALVNQAPITAFATCAEISPELVNDVLEQRFLSIDLASQAPETIRAVTLALEETVGIRTLKQADYGQHAGSLLVLTKLTTELLVEKCRQILHDIPHIELRHVLPIFN